MNSKLKILRNFALSVILGLSVMSLALMFIGQVPALLLGYSVTCILAFVLHGRLSSAGKYPEGSTQIRELYPLRHPTKKRE